MGVQPVVGMLPGKKDNFYDKLQDAMILPSGVVEFYPDATLVVDNRGRVVAWNKAMEEMTGVPAKEMLGKGNYQYAIPLYGVRKPILLDMVGLPREEVNGRYTNVVVCEDKLEAMTIKAKVKGRDVVLWGTAARLYGLNGKPVGAIESIRDVTTYTMTEKRLMESEEKYRMITTSTNDGIITTDMEGIISYVNPSAQKILGTPASHILGRNFMDLVAGEYKNQAVSEFCRGISGATIPPFEIEIVDVNGKRIPVELNGGTLELDGIKKGAIFTFRDISERLKARLELMKAHEDLERRVEERTQELARARQMLQAILDRMPAGVLVTDAESRRFSYANRSALRMFGDNIQGLSLFSPEKSYEMLWPDGSKPETDDLPLSRSMYHGEHISDVEMLVRHRDSRETSILFSSAPVKDRQGRVIGAVSSSIDITERKRIESALIESEEKFRVLTETTSSAIFIYQHDRFRYVNPASCQITGYSKEELLSMSFWDWVHPDYREMVRNNGHARRRGQPAPLRYEIKFVTKYGEERWAEITPGLIEYNKKPAVLVTAVDVTERKRTEEALKSAKDNAEMYLDLMGHDINNMNQVALGYLELALDTMPADPVSVYLSRSYAMLRDSSRLIENLRKVQQAIGRKLKLETVDLGAILSEVAAEFAPVPEREVIIEYRPEECHVRANQLLKDVFSNIVGNAVKHSSGPLKISIGIRPVVQNGKRYCQAYVEDNGPGIPDGLKETIFSRSKRGQTKARGSGLGLYIVKSLVEGFSGRVWVEDRVPGESALGSRFVVQLPAAD